MKNIATMAKSAVLSACVAAATLAAFGDTWFDAAIPTYTSWPDDGSPYTVDGVGEWTGTTNTELVVANDQKWLSVFAAEGTPLVFTPLQSRSVATDEPTMVFEVKFTEGTSPLEADQTLKGSVTVVDDNGTAVYMGLMKDPDGATNVWRQLSGATPDLANAVELRVSLRTENGVKQVRYAVGNAVLTSSYGEWAPTAYTDGSNASDEVTIAGMLGNGDLYNLSAETVAARVKAALTIPDIDGMGLISVRADGAEVSPEDGTYLVPTGAYITVTFAPDPGKYLDFKSMTFQMGDGAMTLPVAGRPSVVQPSSFLFINEVMASNGDTLGTKNGGAELDWVEFRNDNDDAIDITGWYMYDDATKPNKWVQIEGSCVVPGHGFKIVWCDKSYTNWASDEAHTKFGVGKSGGTVVLATSNSVDSIVTQLVLPPQMKDVSYGRGSRENTVLSTLDQAQYRVGSGEWRNVSGPVGMPGATNLFRVISYKLDASTAKTIPTVEAAIASGNYAPVLTNFVETIAYSNANSSVQTSPEFAQHYKHVGTLGPGVITGSYYAFLCEGVVYIPTATNWTFSVGSDDGFSLRLYNEKYSFESEFPGGRTYGQTPAIFRIHEPGAYNVRLVYFQGTGSATLDFSVKEGEFEDYENFTLDGFHLVGLPESGVTHAGAWEGHALNDVSGEMLGVTDTLEWKGTFTLEEALASDDACKLKVRFADGFTASVNGTVVTNAPAAEQRSLADALVPAVVDVPKRLLVSGPGTTNTVEITAVNDAVDSAEFLLSAEVAITKADGDLVYFRVATPGAANTTAGYGPATPKVAFSVPHGYKTEAFTLELSCAEAPDEYIYYTLDGTSPTTSSTLYTGPITISSTTCVRAAIPQDGAVIQQDSSATYLFLDDILGQTRGVVPTGFPANKAVNSQVMVYGMNQSVVNGADRDRLLRGFTNSVATLSIVIDPANLFDKDYGIYVNAKACDGRAWERTTMVEQIDPKDAANGFSTAAGIRIRGAFSRSPSYPKHSLRLFFRNDYGDGPLEFPLFGDEGTGKFKKVDLRTSQNFSWANGDTKDTFIHEVFSRDTQRDMGDYYTRSRYYNLFINGHYWGVYQTEERGDNDYAESYNGGDNDLYDVIKTSQPGYVTGASEGTIDAWEALWNMAVNEGFSGAYSNNYTKAMGLNPDGTRNPEYPIYLNPTNLMDYMLCSHYTVDYDCPAASSKANNLYAVRDRDDNDDGLKMPGFFYLRHDAEHSLGVNTSNSLYSQDPTTRGTELKHANFKKLAAFNPAELHYKLCSDPRYKMAFADRFYKHCLAPGGALTAEKNRERFESRMAEIDDVVVCEAARWAQKGQTRQTWLNACNDYCFTFFNNRTSYMLQQYRDRGWYPSVDVPVATAPGGGTVTNGTIVAASSSVSFGNNSSGTIYYTTDGSDPRLDGGAVNPSATASSGEGIPVPEEGLTLKARVLTAGGEWSALGDVFVRSELPQADVKDGLRLAEALTAALDGDDTLDYLIVTNVAAGEIRLDGVKIVAWNAKKNTEAKPSLTYFFPAGTSIRPGASLRIDNLDKLTNSQVGLRIYDAEGTLVQDVFLDAGWWNSACDETGEHFIARTFGAEAKTHSDWKPSATAFSANVRVLEMYTSTTDGGDTGEFIVLTNLDASAALDLTDVKLVAWNSKKKSEAEPSLTITLDGVSIPAGGTLTLDQATYFGPGGKLTNSKVGLKIYDPAEACAQEVEVDASWWSSACDGTGEYFVALEFGNTVKTVSQWTHQSPPALADWPTDPDTEITSTTTAADLGITSGAFTNATYEVLRKLSKWAKANSVPYGGEAVNGMSFDANGNPATDLEAAYLLNCAVSEVEAKKAEFKFDEIEPGTVPSIDEVDGSGNPLYNGRVRIFGSQTLEGGGTWSEAAEDLATARFFKARLTL